MKILIDNMSILIYNNHSSKEIDYENIYGTDSAYRID